jgi:hexosaminidase
MVRLLLLTICFTISLISCNPKKTSVPLVPNPPAPFTLKEVPFIPKPLSVKCDSGSFALTGSTKLYTTKPNIELQAILKYLTNEINGKTGMNISNDTKDEQDLRTSIHLKIHKDTILNSPEAYEIKITKDSLQISANKPEGIFRGIQTLLQIIPQGTDSTGQNRPKEILLPLGTVKDVPFFSWRGTMLDVARHFFTVEEVKQYIRVLAAYKINRLHLHLTDDQGWRIAINAYPKLTELGGKTEVGGTPGGYYSQANYKELVTFAAKHYITIIPEVDMPGHTNAASFAYPFLDGTGKSIRSYTGMKVGFSTFDTRKDTVYSFIENVIAEIARMTPGPYFHIGGDESHVTKKDDYRFFVRKVEKLVNKHGKKMIGWDEIANAALDTGSIAQFWNNAENAKKATEKGMKVILSPGKKAYLDMKYNSKSAHGLTWAGYIPTDTAYNWQPETYADIPVESILGIEAPLWSETISNLKELEFLAFPRIIGYAELGWTHPTQRNWEDYRKRLAKHATYLNRKNINYYRSPLIDWEN